MKTWLINKANITFKSRLHIEAGAVGCQIWLLASSHSCTTRERRGQEFAVKVFLESNEKDYNKNSVPSGYKGGRILNLESPLCLRLGSSCGGGE